MFRCRRWTYSPKNHTWSCLLPATSTVKKTCIVSNGGECNTYRGNSRTGLRKSNCRSWKNKRNGRRKEETSQQGTFFAGPRRFCTPEQVANGQNRESVLWQRRTSSQYENTFGSTWSAGGQGTWEVWNLSSVSERARNRIETLTVRHSLFQHKFEICTTKPRLKDRKLYNW